MIITSPKVVSISQNRCTTCRELLRLMSKFRKGDKVQEVRRQDIEEMLFARGVEIYICYDGIVYIAESDLFKNQLYVYTALTEE